MLRPEFKSGEMGPVLIRDMCTFFMTFLFLGMVYGNESEVNSTDESISEKAARAQDDTHTESSKESFTERFLSQHAGRKVDLRRLLEEYALICPLADTCGINIEKKFIFQGVVEPINTECPVCSCTIGCNSNYYIHCCPGTYYKYVDYKCINTTLFTQHNYKSYFMVATCLKEYQNNTTMVEMCASSISPCTSVISGLIYKNQHCGICNKESDCIPWKIEVKCLLGDYSFSNILAKISSLSEINNILTEHKCEVDLVPPEFQNRANFVCRMHDDRDRTYVNSCNVTGLWDNYDSDINWACEHLVLPYKEFQNVFCYICNPSIANMQNVKLIDNCINSTVRYKYNDDDIHEACESLPATSRLKPFKNIYCYACKKGQHPVTTDEYAFFNISEKNSISKLETELSFYILVLGQNRTLSLKHFLQNTFDETFKPTEIKSTLYKTRDLYKQASRLNEIHSNYIAVCGTETICNATQYQTNKTYGNPVCGQCNCDSTCAENETCCPDLIFQKEPYSCLEPPTFPSLNKNTVSNQRVKPDLSLLTNVSGSRYKVIDKCLAEQTDDILVEKCSSFGEQSDIVISIPVTMDSGISYKNVYCFSCNNNKSNLFVAFQVLCDVYIEHKLFTSMLQLLDAVNMFCNKVLFIPLKSRNCETKYDSFKAGLIDGEKYVRRQVHPSLLDARTEEWVYVYEFNKNDIVRSVYSTCNQTGYLKEEDKLLNDICESEAQNILSLPEYRIENSVYKNFACFLCNPVVQMLQTDSLDIISNCSVNTSVEWYEHNTDLEELCHVEQFHPRWFPFKNMYCSECSLPPLQLVDVRSYYSGESSAISGYRYIFSLSRDEFERVVLAPKSEKIPNCSSGTFDHSLKKCRSLYCKGGFQLFNYTCVPVLETATNKHYKIELKLRYLSDVETNYISANDKGNTSMIIDLSDLCSRVLANISQPFQELAEMTTSYSCYVAPFESPINSSFYNIVSIETIHLHIYIDIIYTENISFILRSLVKAQNEIYHIDNILDIQGIHQSIDFIADARKKRFSFFSDVILYEYKYSESSLKVVDKFYLCPLVKFNYSEAYLDMETGDIYFKEKNLSFTFDEYKLTEQSVVTCMEDFNRKIQFTRTDQMFTDTSHLEPIFYVFDLVCSLISIVCLLLTIATYSLFSSLRTIPGKNTMTLCVFLLSSQAFLQFGLDVSKATSLCKVIGACIHYCWLASFSAMNISSFHTFRVFACNDNLGRLSGRFLFFKYFIYIISLPMACVLTTVSINLVQSEGSSLGYGERLCFISDFYIFLGTFLIPAGMMFLSNIVFFAIGFHKIRTTRRVQSTHERNNFFIFLKLCAVIGLAWPLLIVDNIIGLTWFSFVVSGLNSLQGVFIFFSFIFNRRVAALYSSCFRKPSAKRVLNIAGTSTSSPKLTNLTLS